MRRGLHKSVRKGAVEERERDGTGEGHSRKVRGHKKGFSTLFLERSSSLYSLQETSEKP